MAANSNRLRNHDEIISATHQLAAALGKYGKLPDFTEDEWADLDQVYGMLGLLRSERTFHPKEKKT